MGFNEGMSAFKAGDYEQAAHEFVAVTEADEHNHKGWNALGICLSKTGEYEAAHTCFENALALDAGNATYQKNLDKNDKKRGIEPDLELDDEPAPLKTQIPKKRVEYTPPQTDEGDRFSNKLSIILAVAGFFFGVCIAAFLLVMGGIGSAFGASGSEMIGGRAYLMMFLCFVGVLSSIVRHKRYGSLILILTGILLIISVSAFGLIPGALFIVSGYLIFRETGFDFGYYLDFKTDLFKKGLFTFIIILCLIVTVSSLASPSTNTVSSPIKSTTATSSTAQVDQPVASSPVTASSAYDFSKVTHSTVSAFAKSWDADAANDGIIIYPDLKDAADAQVTWSGIELPVDVEIWTTGYDKNFKTIPETKIYSGTGYINSWKDGNMFMGPGIKIPFDQMTSPGDKTIGRTRIVINLPDGRLLEAIYDLTPLKP